MLKKLVKYGNSNALVLDRAILELLNMGEGSVVKLHTDGKSLIITPAPTETNAKISVASGQELMAHTIESRFKESMAEINADPIKKQQAAEWMPGTPGGLKLAEAFKKIMGKYKDDMMALATSTFAQDVDLLAEKYDGDKTSAEFMQEVMDLRYKLVPNLADMDKEMREAQKELGMPAYL
ncbi:AbrB/MazE/SpoVT family DNA-binding domain-containing protein [Candidatus Babeliales bacterium]|nr:AbrB/MazE/SpoVT family DNA-binding domain-containing protein [Candidatus Babeliales bacterium]